MYDITMYAADLATMTDSEVRMQRITHAESLQRHGDRIANARTLEMARRYLDDVQADVAMLAAATREEDTRERAAYVARKHEQNTEKACQCKDIPTVAKQQRLAFSKLKACAAGIKDAWLRGHVQYVIACGVENAFDSITDPGTPATEWNSIFLGTMESMLCERECEPARAWFDKRI